MLSLPDKSFLQYFSPHAARLTIRNIRIRYWYVLLPLHVLGNTFIVPFFWLTYSFYSLRSSIVSVSVDTFLRSAHWTQATRYRNRIKGVFSYLSYNIYPILSFTALPHPSFLPSPPFHFNFSYFSFSRFALFRYLFSMSSLFFFSSFPLLSCPFSYSLIQHYCLRFFLFSSSLLLSCVSLFLPFPPSSPCHISLPALLYSLRRLLFRLRPFLVSFALLISLSFLLLSFFINKLQLLLIICFLCYPKFPAFQFSFTSVIPFSILLHANIY